MKLLKILQQRVCELLLAGAGRTLIGAQPHSTTPNPLVLPADQAWKGRSIMDMSTMTSTETTSNITTIAMIF